jgi:hypothetical protein
MVTYMHKKRLHVCAAFALVAPLGLEPRHTVPKTAVLPIRRWGIVNESAKLIQPGFLTIDYKGMFPCFRFGLCATLFSNMAKARISFWRVWLGSMTSST